MVMQRRFQFVPDPELVAMAQLGSLEAYDELVGRFHAAVLLVANQVLASPEVAQDVAQEAFLLAFRSLGQLQDPTKFAGWLYAITRHRARRVGASKGRSQTLDISHVEERMIAPVTTEAADPLDQLLRAEREGAVRALLAGLAPEYQIVLRLFYYEQWPAARIAQFLSLPLTTIKWRLRYGRKQLCHHFAEFMEEKPHVRTRRQKRDPADANSAAEDGGDGGTRRADGQL